MPIVVEVAFKPLSKLISCAPGLLDLHVDEAVLVEGESGLEFGFVTGPGGRKAKRVRQRPFGSAKRKYAP